jgi:hypothetical protein
MKSNTNSSRVLGIAFLLQVVTSLTSGMIMKAALVVPGNISETMINIANNPFLMRVNILGEMITAAGIIFLGAVLFVTLRKQNEIMALTGLGLYILEAVMLALSRMEAFSLLNISQQYVAAGNPASLLATGKLAFESMNFGYTLLMLAFCLGAMPLYYLLYKSGIIPRVLSLWGLVTVPVCLAATLFVMFGAQVPFFVYLPYAPFEFVVGGWIVIKGLKIQGPEVLKADWRIEKGIKQDAMI